MIIVVLTCGLYQTYAYAYTFTYFTDEHAH